MLRNSGDRWDDLKPSIEAELARLPKGVAFDRDSAQRAVNFFEKVLKHGKGAFAGKYFSLLPWQFEIIALVFGLVDSQGLRQFRKAYIEVPKKCGKSEMAAGVALYLMVGDSEPGCELYSAAAAKDQAGLVFKVAASMVEASDVLKRQLRVIRSTKLIHKKRDIDSFYRAVAADGDTIDGVNPHGVIADELHRWKHGKAIDLWDVLQKGMIARTQPLTFAITTAGLPEESPLAWKDHQFTKAIAKGEAQGPRFFGRIFGADPEDDWLDVRTWTKAIPSLATNPGGFISVDAIQTLAEEAAQKPEEVAAFKRFHLNMWGQKDNRWIDMQAWDACATPLRRPKKVERQSQPCFVGLDLSVKTDLTAAARVWPYEDGSYDCDVHFFIPKEGLRQRELRDKQPYSHWIKEGLITACEGPVVDLDAVEAYLRQTHETYGIFELAYDPWNAGQLMKKLTDSDIPLIEVRQNFGNLSEPTKLLQEKVLQRLFRHGGNKVLRWNADCTAIKSDDNDNIRPVKPDRNKTGKRIDGILAAILALSRAMLQYERGSAYEKEGLTFLQ